MDTVFDTPLLLARKRRALATRNESARFLMLRAAEELGDRLAVVQRRFERAAAFCCLTEDAATALRASGKAESVARIENAAYLLDPGDGGIVAPPETVPLEPASVDLLASLLSLHEVNDLPGVLLQIRRALRPDGLFLASLMAAGTLTELRQSLLRAEMEMHGGGAPRVSPFPDLRDLGALLQRAGFALPVADLDPVTVRYPDMFELMRDLRAMGATCALVERSRRPATRALFLRAARIYADEFADPDGRVRATFNVAWLSGWSPHGSQPKPLEPGSARMSLRDALRKVGG